MKTLLIIIALLISSQFVSAQWIKQSIDTTAPFRGLSVVNARVIWASGTGGTVVRTTNGGQTWSVFKVPGADKLDFRDIEAFDANTAYILSIGNGDASRIYKTIDGGKTWQMQFTNTDEKAFYDAIACWDRNSCIAMSDPVGEFYQLIATKDGGSTWRHTGLDKMPRAKTGEAAFAASGTCLITSGKQDVFLVSGGTDARVFRSTDRGLAWFVADSPITKGTSGSGIFSIAMRDANNGVIVGGNYEKPDEAKDNLAFTSDGGRTWKPGTGLTGYRSGVAYIDARTIIAVGTNGSDISKDGGRTWTKLGSENLNAVAAKTRNAVWSAGPNGMIARLAVK